VWSRLSQASALLQPRHIRGCTQLPPQSLAAAVQLPQWGRLPAAAPRRPGCTGLGQSHADRKNPV
jgi:hypothetical protein